MILQINKMYAPEIGGVESVVKEYSEFLQEYDDVSVLAIKANFSLRTSVEYINGVKVYRCASLGTYMSMPLSLVFFIYLFFLAKKANVIHFHEPFPLGCVGSFLVSKEKKIFVTWHSDIIKQKSIKHFFEFFQKRLCAKAHTIIATSKNLIDFSPILRRFRQKVEVIPLAIDPEKYETIEMKNVSLEHLPSEYVLFLGRFSYYKGIFVLLEAIEKVDKKVPFVIAGNGELLDEIKKRITRIDREVVLIDRFVTEDEKKYLLKNSKFMVFPSIYPSEAFGIIQLESMIYSKPVINTTLPTGVPWVSLDMESGLSVEVGNSIALANAIERLYFDEKLYQKLSRGACDRFKNLFTNKRVNAQLHSLYFGK